MEAFLRVHAVTSWFVGGGPGMDQRGKGLFPDPVEAREQERLDAAARADLHGQASASHSPQISHTLFWLRQLGCVVRHVPVHLHCLSIEELICACVRSGRASRASS